MQCSGDFLLPLIAGALTGLALFAVGFWAWEARQWRKYERERSER